MKTPFLLTRRQAEELVAAHGSPLMVGSLQAAEDNFATFRRLLPRVVPHYAMKANPAPELVELFARLGAHFDVASLGEIEQLRAAGVDGSRMLYANTVKPVASMKAARAQGVTRVTFDNQCEIEKIAQAMPGAQVLLRIRVINPGALVNLNKKFGAWPSEALPLLQSAREAGLDPVGLSFHVGSQTRSPEPYLQALATARRLFDDAAQEGLHLKVLDIGGGFPIPELGYEIDSDGLMEAVNDELDRLFPDTELWAEPGRYFCGTAFNLLTTVIGREERDSVQWYFLDDGLYGSFSGVIFDHWNFDLITDRQGETETCTFAGPSCDSLDILFENRQMPRLEPGDLLITPACGAYTSASATTFNGFPQTKRIFID